MSESARRRLNLGDALIVIATIAFLLSLARSQPYDRGDFSPYEGSPPHWSWVGFRRALDFGLDLARPFVATLTLGVLALRLRHPRPHWNHLVDHPGTSAGLATGAVLAVEALRFLAECVATLRYGFEDPRSRIAQLFAENDWSGVIWPGSSFDPNPVLDIGIAVLAVWSVQALGGRWRRDRGWLDRAGRGLGWAWILMMFLRFYATS